MPSQARPPAAAANEGPRTAERRAAARYACIQKCMARPEGATGVGDWHAIVYNLSATGVGLTLPYPVQAGTVLVVEPWGRDKARGLRARVVRSSPVAFLWFHGCGLIDPLSDTELQAWLT
jgi:hypothetical protein